MLAPSKNHRSLNPHPSDGEMKAQTGSVPASTLSSSWKLLFFHEKGAWGFGRRSKGQESVLNRPIVNHRESLCLPRGLPSPGQGAHSVKGACQAPGPPARLGWAIGPYITKPEAPRNTSAGLLFILERGLQLFPIEGGFAEHRVFCIFHPFAIKEKQETKYQILP